LLRIKADLHNITPLPRQTCTQCGSSKLVVFEFNKNAKVSLPPKQKKDVLVLVPDVADTDLSYAGCIVCDDFLTALTEIIGGRTMVSILYLYLFPTPLPNVSVSLSLSHVHIWQNLTVLRQIRHRRGMLGRGRGRGRGRGSRPKGDVKMSFSDF
jgi:hypothetical protein